MTNPYAGITGYNLALDHAIVAATTVIDASATGDERILRIGLDIVCAIARLKRTPRNRRRSWRRPVIAEMTQPEGST